ncbi:MAG: response regulator [Ichthyobacteriaceae bacterium]|nr:response regulator [Ichthyobacteriaceae bacterium]
MIASILENTYELSFLTLILLLVIVFLNEYRNERTSTSINFQYSIILIIGIYIINVVTVYIDDENVLVKLFSVRNFLGRLVHLYFLLIVLEISGVHKKYANIAKVTFAIFTIVFIGFCLTDRSYIYTNYVIENDDFSKQYNFTEGIFNVALVSLLRILGLVTFYNLTKNIITKGINTPIVSIGYSFVIVIYLTNTVISKLSIQITTLNYYQFSLAIGTITTSYFINSKLSLDDIYKKWKSPSMAISYISKTHTFIFIYISYVISQHLVIFSYKYLFYGVVDYKVSNTALLTSFVITPLTSIIIAIIVESHKNYLAKLSEGNKKINEAINKAKEANMAKGNFLSTISHEIRTPMNGIIGMAELLNKDTNDSTVESYSDKIVTSSNNLMTVINDILDLSKMEKSKLPLTIKSFGIEGLKHQNILKKHKISAEEKGLTINYFNTSECTHLHTDKTIFLRILNNMVSNAIKFTDKGSISIIFSSKKLNNNTTEFITEVKDTGLGIDLNKTENLFDKFQQADTSNTRKFGGTGLGLTISKKLSILLGGDISVKSEIGKGSTFKFSIKFNENDIDISNCKLKPNTNINNCINGNKLNILIAEDNKINQLILNRIITDLNHNTVIASNGEEAVNLAINNHFDLIFMDIQMPKLNGFEASAQIKEHCSNNTIIGISANDIDINKYKNFYSTISKPFNKDDIQSAIEVMVNC